MESTSNKQINTHSSPFQSNDSTAQQQSKSNPLEQQLQESIKYDYEVLNKLGSGAYGHVWKIKDKKTQEVYALKKVFSAFQNQVDAQRTYREIVYLNKLSKHQNVIKLIKVIKANNDMDIYLLFQYMQSDLFYAIKEDLLNQLHKKYIIYQIANCLKYVHSAGLVHRDVKPSNILIKPNCEIKLCDFGLSRSLWRYNDQQPKLTQFIATRWYRAPEVLFGSQLYDTKSDMWSLGCLIYELYARRPLLPGNDTVEQIQKVIQFKGFPNLEQKKSFRIPKIDQILGLFDLEKKPLNEYFKYLPSEQVKQLLIHLLQYNPEKRWSAADLLNCSFLSQFKQFQVQLYAQKQIKTGIHDNQRKTVETYRNMIYNAFVYDSAKKYQNIKNKLQVIRQNKNNTQRQVQKKFTLRQSSSQLLTENRKSKIFLKTNSTTSLHFYKGSKGSFGNTQRISHRKNVSSHSVSKFNRDIISSYKTNPQKPVLTQMKSNKNNPRFQFNFKRNSEAPKMTRNSTSKDKQGLTANYPSYLKSSNNHGSASKIPKMIQQKIHQQRTIFNKIIAENSMSKQKSSPYIPPQQENHKFESSKFSSHGSKNVSIHQPSSKNINQNKPATNGGARKLKRKGIVN